MVKKSWKIALCCTVILLTAAGLSFKLLCEDKRPKVTLVIDTMESQYWKIVASGAKKAFRDFDINGQLLVKESGGPTWDQLLKHALERNPDALVVAPIQLADIMPVLSEYKNRNIPVLFIDTNADWKDKTAYVGTDNRLLGQKAGQLLASMLQPGDKVALIGGHAENVDERIEGAKAALEAAGLKTATQQFDEVDDMETIWAILNFLMNPGSTDQVHSHIKGVFATYDTLALRVLQLLEEQGYKLPVVGADGIMDMVKTVEAGTLTATVAQNPYDMGYQSVENALKAIHGEIVDKRIDSGVDIITQDNAKDKLEFLTDILDDK